MYIFNLWTTVELGLIKVKQTINDDSNEQNKRDQQRQHRLEEM